MYCRKCGAKINDHDKFCNSCGESVYKEDKEKQLKQPSSTGKKKKFKIAIIGILLFLIIIVVALIFVITKQNKKEEQLNQLKEQLKNADSYLSGYIIDEQDDIEEWKTQGNWAVENQNIEAAKKLLLEWDEIIEQIDKLINQMNHFIC